MNRGNVADRVSALERLALRLELAAAACQTDQTELAMLARDLELMAKGLSPTDLTALQRDSLHRVGTLLLRQGQVRMAYGAAG